MPRVPAVSGSEAVAAFAKAGFCLARVKGSHHILKIDSHPNRLSIPVHAGKTVGRGLLKDQIEKAGLTVEQFNELLRAC